MNVQRKHLFVITGLILLLAGVAFIGCSEKINEPQVITIVATPSVVVGEGWEDGTQPRAVNVIVSTTTGDTIPYKTSKSAPWLSLFGDTTGATPDTFTVMMGIGSLEPGNTYTDTVWVEAPDAGNSPLPIEATVTVHFIVSSNTDSLSFIALKNGDAPAPQEFAIYHFSGTPFDYTLSHSQSWLNLSKTSGQSPDTITVNVNADGLSTGTYVDTVVINVPLGEHAGFIYCELTVEVWINQQDPITGGELRGVDFVDENHGWISGQLLSALERTGYIIATTDGGKHWQLQTLDIPEILGDIQFLDSQTGFAVGAHGMIVKTTDGGNSWNIISTPDTLDLAGLHFPEITTGWATGREGAIFHTTDTGSTWVSQVSNTNNDLSDIFSISPDSAWIAGNGGTVLFTADSGNHWVNRTVGEPDDLRDVYFVDNMTGWIVGDGGAIFRTDDAGENWTKQDAPVNNNLRAVFFADNTHGWIVGMDGVILSTSDGTAWIQQTSGTDRALWDVAIVNGTLGWVVGDNGTILHTATGGL